jgi:hypothetical protein
LVLGGSQGALARNRTVPEALAHLPPELRPEVRHQAGRNTLEGAEEAYQRLGVAAEGAAYSLAGKFGVDAFEAPELLLAARRATNELMGVSFHVGREANATYGETWNGNQVGILHHGHHWKKLVDPYVVPGDPTSGLLPRISADPPGTRGEADARVQAYCFRMCLTNVPENRVPFPKPTGYDPAEYELLARTFAAGWREVFNKFDPIPTADYYALYGVFQSSAEALVPCSPEPPGAELAALLAKHRDLLTKRREYAGQGQPDGLSECGLH